MWLRGDLILHHRSGARRYFDLIARHLPEELRTAPDPNPREEDYHAWQLRRRIGSVGLLPDGPSGALLGALMKVAER